MDWDLRLRWAALRARYYFGTSRNPGVGLSTLGLNAATMAFGLSCREWCRGEEVLAIISEDRLTRAGLTNRARFHSGSRSWCCRMNGMWCIGSSDEGLVLAMERNRAKDGRS